MSSARIRCAGGALTLATVLLTACTTPSTSRLSATPGAPAPAAPGVVIRYFAGVLVLPAEYVFDGTALPGQVRFLGPQGQLRLGTAREARAYVLQAERTAQQREEICGLDVLRHGTDDPPLYLLRAGDAYALAWDRDPAVVRRMLELYCASLGHDG